jgi:integrase/recombinase XerD
VRWLQEVRRYEASTVSRRTSAGAGYYRACAIDGVLTRSPADYPRRPTVPAVSPTLGLTRLQFEGPANGRRDSADPPRLRRAAPPGRWRCASPIR